MKLEKRKRGKAEASEREGAKEIREGKHRGKGGESED